MNRKPARQAGLCRWVFLGLVTAGILSCSPKAILDQKPKIPVYRYEQLVHNDGFRGKFAFETHDVISVTPQSKAIDSTFGFTGMIMSKLVKEKHHINIIRLDKDLIWDIDLNEKKYTETPIAKMPLLNLKTAAPPEAGAENVYVEDCCRLVTDVKRTGAEKVINGYAATQVIFSARTECKDASEPTSTQISMEVWYAKDLKLGEELSAFDAAYAQKVGFDADLMAAMGQQALKMFPALRDLEAMMGQIKGYPILTIISVEDEKLLERLREERARADSEKSETPTSATAMVTGFFAKKYEEHERKKQAEEDLKWGNTVFKMSVEARNFGPADVSASVFELSEGLKKVELREIPEGPAAVPVEGAKPARYIATSCFSTLDKAALGVDLYPKATPARERPYGAMDHNTMWFYKDPNNYRIQYATADGFDQVVDFYKKVFGAAKCSISNQQKEGATYREAVCTGKTISFRMDDRPLEVTSAWSMPTGSEAPVETQSKRLAFVLSRGSGIQ
jgi:hypothetical protein